MCVEAAGPQQTVLWAVGWLGTTHVMGSGVTGHWWGRWPSDYWVAHGLVEETLLAMWDSPGHRRLCAGRQGALVQEGCRKDITGLRLQGHRLMVFCAYDWGRNPLQTPHPELKIVGSLFLLQCPPRVFKTVLTWREKCLKGFCCFAYHRAHIEGALGTEATNK